MASDCYWSEKLRQPREQANWSLHVAIFQEPFLRWVLEKRKTVESRFSQKQVAPFGEVQEGDVIALKRVGGPIVGVCAVNATWSYRLDSQSWAFVREHFAPLICAYDDDFWEARKDARFATLVSMDKVRAIPDIPYPKTDRRGWVVEQNRRVQGALSL